MLFKRSPQYFIEHEVRDITPSTNGKQMTAKLIPRILKTVTATERFNSWRSNEDFMAKAPRFYEFNQSRELRGKQESPTDTLSALIDFYAVAARSMFLCTTKA